MSQTTYTLSQPSGMSAPQSVQVLDGAYEHPPWATGQTVTQHPFVPAEALVATMRSAMDTVSTEPQLKLVRAHPELTGKMATRGKLTAKSTHE